MNIFHSNNSNICSSIRKNFYCSYMLEVLAAELLTKYIDVAELRDDYAEAVLRIIALESKKHAECIELIAKKFNLFEQDDCENVVGEPWRKLRELLEQLNQGVKLDLKSFIEKQIWLEKAVGEETYQRMLLPLALQAMKAGCIDDKVVKTMEIAIDKIINDEKWHEKALRTLYEVSVG